MRLLHLAVPADRSSMGQHNYVEDAVFQTAERLAGADPEFCGCERSVTDVAAHASGHLTPVRRVPNRRGRHPSGNRLCRPPGRDRGQVTEAIRLVQAHPRH